MGNCMEVYDKEGHLIGESSHGMMCKMYIDEIVKKYNPHYDPYSFTMDINEELKPVYNIAPLDDQLILLIFINDESSFDESDLVHFDQAIAKLEEGNRIHQNIKKHLIAYREVLEKHRFVRIKYTGVSTSVMTIHTKK